MRNIIHLSVIKSSIIGSILLSVAVTVQAANLVSAERTLATVFSRNLAPAVDLLRCFALSEQQIAEHINRIFMGETLNLTSPADHQFEFRLTDDGLQQRFVDNEWHNVDGAAYRVLLTVTPEQRWRMFDAVQSIITGTSMTDNLNNNLEAVPESQITTEQLVVDDVKVAVGELPRYNNLMIIEGVGLTGHLANFLKQPKNHAIADRFYQFLTPLVANILDGLRGKHALNEIASIAVSSDQQLSLHAHELSNGNFIYFAIDSSNQPEWIILSALNNIENPHNASIIGMARKAVNQWDSQQATQLEHRYPELIEEANTESRNAEILLRAFEVVRRLAPDPQLTALDELLTDESVLSLEPLIDKYLDLISELYFMFFSGTDYNYDKLLIETENLVKANNLIIALDDYPAMIDFLQTQPQRVVNNMVYSSDLLNLHYHKTKNLIDFWLIDDLAKTAQLLEANNTTLTDNPEVVAVLSNINIDTVELQEAIQGRFVLNNAGGIDNIDGNKALANLLDNWQAKFTDLRELYTDLRKQFTNHVNIELQRIQPYLDDLKIKLLAKRKQEGRWAVLGNDRKIIVTSQFAEFYQHHKQRITDFDLSKVIHMAGGLRREMLEQLTELSENHLNTDDLTSDANLEEFLGLLGDPYEVKLVGNPYIANAGSNLVLNGIETRYDLPKNSRPVYQLTYQNYRFYAQTVQLDDRIHLAFLNGFHKEAKSTISDFIQWMQKNRQSKAIVDAINILAQISYDEEQQIAQFKLEQSARQLYRTRRQQMIAIR